MKILVTGGAGFIGSNLCEKLLNEGNEVYCLDNLYSSSHKNIEHLLTNENFHFVEHDIVNKINLEEKFDQIYNLACPASPVWYQKDPIQTVRTNTEGVINILELARKNNARILQSSTSEVYGDPIEHPQKESYKGNVNTLGPRACYDEGKRLAETLFMDYHRTYGVDVRIIRIFNTYGPKMAVDDGRVVSNFIIEALKGEPITIYGKGGQTRSFQFVSDLLAGMTSVMNTENITGPINLGNPNEFTIKELAEKVLELTHSKSQLIYSDLPIDDPKQRQPDITLAKKELGWEPKIQLNEGLEKTIEYFSSILK